MKVSDKLPYYVIMFMRENVPLLCKHHTCLTENDATALPLELRGIPAVAAENDVEVGADLSSQKMII